MMKPIPNFLRSFAITMIISFAFPVLLVLSLLALALGVSYFPGLENFGQASLRQLAVFLSIFGAGSVLRGIIVIGLTLALVAGWFDLYTLYRCYRFKPFQSQNPQNPIPKRQ